jgi:hypothetical protein
MHQERVHVHQAESLAARAMCLIKARFLQRRPRAILTHATLPAPRAPGFVSDRIICRGAVSQDPLWYKDAVSFGLHARDSTTPTARRRRLRG